MTALTIIATPKGSDCVIMMEIGVHLRIFFGFCQDYFAVLLPNNVVHQRFGQPVLGGHGVTQKLFGPP